MEIDINKEEIKHIPLCPKSEDCRVSGGTITGWMRHYDGGILYTYKAPAPYTFREEEYALAIRNFKDAIRLCSKRYQVEELLNQHFGNINGTFEIQDCPVNPYSK